MVRSGNQTVQPAHARSWTMSMAAGLGLFLVIALVPAFAFAADLYVAGALMNSFTAADGAGEIALGTTNPPTPLFNISGSDKDSSPGFGGSLGFGFGVDELRARLGDEIARIRTNIAGALSKISAADTEVVSALTLALEDEEDGGGTVATLTLRYIPPPPEVSEEPAPSEAPSSEEPPRVS